MKNIGCHVSNKGYVSMYKDTIYVGGNTFQFFTRNPRGGSAKEIDLEDIDKFNQLKKEANFAPLIAHAPYTLNPASSDERVREFALKVFKIHKETLFCYLLRRLTNRKSKTNLF